MAEKQVRKPVRAQIETSREPNKIPLLITATTAAIFIFFFSLEKENGSSISHRHIGFVFSLVFTSVFFSYPSDSWLSKKKSQLFLKTNRTISTELAKKRVNSEQND